MNFTRHQLNNEKEWLDFKNTYIGGIGASVIMGMNKHKDSSQYMKERKGLIQKEDISNKPQVIYGKEAEYYIRELFKLKYNNILYIYNKDYECLLHKDYTFIGADLDGEIEVLQDCVFDGISLKKGMKGVYECKTSTLNSPTQKEEWKDGIPQEYYLQCLHYLIITDYDFVILNAELTYPSLEENDISHTKVIKQYVITKESRKEELEYLLKKEIEWQKEYFEKDIEPPLILDL